MGQKVKDFYNRIRILSKIELLCTVYVFTVTKLLVYHLYTRNKPIYAIINFISMQKLLHFCTINVDVEIFFYQFSRSFMCPMAEGVNWIRNSLVTRQTRDGCPFAHPCIPAHSADCLRYPVVPVNIITSNW